MASLRVVPLRSVNGRRYVGYVLPRRAPSALLPKLLRLLLSQWRPR